LSWESHILLWLTLQSTSLTPAEQFGHNPRQAILRFREIRMAGSILGKEVAAFRMFGPERFPFAKSKI
jgi:hypothetical protein